MSVDNQVIDPPTNKPADAAPVQRPEKFKSEADLIKAYTELERKFTEVSTKAKQPEPANQLQEVPNPEVAVTPSQEAAKPPITPVEVDIATLKPSDAAELLKKHNLDASKYEQEFLANKKLSPESLAELAKAGISEEKVTAYAAARTMEALELHQDILKSTGMTDAQLNEHIEWTANLPEDDLATYKEMVESNDPKKIKAALKFSIMAREKMEGKAPNLIEGRPAPLKQGYQSMAEMRADMRDPRYAADPAFRSMVDEKLKAAHRSGALAKWQDG